MNDEIKELREEIAKLRERVAVLEQRQSNPFPWLYKQPIWSPSPHYDVTCKEGAA